MRSKKVFFGIGWGGLIGIRVTALAILALFIFSLVHTNWKEVNDFDGFWLAVISPMTWIIPLLGIPITFLCSVSGFVAGIISALLQGLVKITVLAILNGIIGIGVTYVILEFVRLLTMDDWTTNSFWDFLQGIILGDFWSVFLFIIPSLFIIASFALLGRKFYYLTYDELVE